MEAKENVFLEGSGQQFLGMAYVVIIYRIVHYLPPAYYFLLISRHFPKPILYALTPILPNFPWTM